MAGLQGSSSSEGDTTGTNTFSNDGSFMEQFMKMQKEKPEPKTDTATASTPLSGVKPPAIKKFTPTSLVQKRIKSLAAKKAGSDNKTKEELNLGPGGLNFNP